VLPALSCGLFSIAVLNVNNIRDMESDRLAGKYSIPVRVGKMKAVVYHWGLLAGGFACALGYTLIHYQSPWQYLFILTAPLFFRNGRAVQTRSGSDLDKFLKQLALSTLLFVLLFGIGLVL
jgi:1,4-dihydroxy-2-naphthoate polyprenyltransferase